MEAPQIYTLQEIIILIILTAIGTGAFTAFVILSDKMKINVWIAILLFTINLFVVGILIEILRLIDLIKYNYIVALLGSYLGLYLLQYIDSRKFKIFDSMINKTGLELKDSSEDNKDEPKIPEDNGK